MATQAQYAAALAAVKAIIDRDLQRVPVFLRSRLPIDEIAKFETEVAHACVDAAEKAK